jgi:uncharacterized protein (TIGR03083 family)
MYLAGYPPTDRSTSMTLSRSEISDGLVEELRAFEQLIRPLSQAELDSPSRCAGWTVGDVARHVIGSMADVTAGRLDGLGSPEATAREVAERSDRTAAQLADECSDVATAAVALLQVFDDSSWNAHAGSYDGTIGQGVETLWYDTWLHGDDIRNALGRPSELGSTAALECALAHVGLALSKRDWTGDVPTSTDPRALAFVLAATGRGGAEAFGPNAPIDIYA